MAGYNSISAQPAGHTPTAGEWTNMVQIMANAMEMYPVRKTSDESLSTNTTAQTDDELFVAVGSSKVYQVHMAVIYEAGTTGDFKYGFTFPSLATMTWGTISANATTLTTVSTAAFGSATSGTSLFAAGGNGAGNQLMVLIEGVLVTSSNAGTLQFIWAQNASDATATIVKTNSLLMLTRIG